MAYLEFIHNLVETMDKYFENVCELDIMFNLEKAHYIINEMIMCGQIIETNKALILSNTYFCCDLWFYLAPVIALDKSKWGMKWFIGLYDLKALKFILNLAKESFYWFILNLK